MPPKEYSQDKAYCNKSWCAADQWADDVRCGPQVRLQWSEYAPAILARGALEAGGLRLAAFYSSASSTADSFALGVQVLFALLALVLGLFTVGLLRFDFLFEGDTEVFVVSDLTVVSTFFDWT